MTEEQRKALAENPKDFLKKSWYHEKQIKMKLEQIRHYREMAESITAEIKEVTTFSLTPSCKVENCVIEMVTLQEDIQIEVQALRSDLKAVQEAIDAVEDESQHTLLTARYLRHMQWEEIAILLDKSYRWTLRLHGMALENISKIFS